ncbi:HEAT repeat domain-containing protein [bacterium]|nr:HEAT repeat domain-containing protein [bacterium]
MKRFSGFFVLAAMIVLMIGCGNTIDLQVNKLYSKDTRADAVKILSKAAPEDAFYPVAEILKAQDGDLVATAIEIMKAWGPEGISEPLKQLIMETDNNNLATNGLHALAEVAGTSEEDFFIARLKDERPMVVVQTLSELGNIKSVKAVEPLYDFLDLELMRTGTLQMAINTLTKIGDKKAAPKLEALLYSGVESTTLKINLVKAISSIDADKGFEIAEKEITASTGDIRYFTALLNVFSSIKDVRIVPILKDLKQEVGPGLGKKIDAAVIEIEKE